MGIQTDGYQTLMAFSTDSSLSTVIEEINPQPSGLEGGDAIDTTTMRNSTWRTMAPQGLKTKTPITYDCAYDSLALDTLQSHINVIQQFTISFPDGSSEVIYGFLQNAIPGNNEIGARPTMSLTIVPTMQDSSGTEQNPNYIGD